MDLTIHRISPALAVCQGYDPAVKADLFSTLLRLPTSQWILIDPLPLSEAQLREILHTDPVAGIIVTNENHSRAAATLATKLQLPIHTRAPLAFPVPTLSVLDHQKIAGDLLAITIEGAPAGEIALHSPADGGTLILGDALINMDALGFTFLPAKYCTDPKLMRRSLKKLLTYDFARLLFAHGTPIVDQAKASLTRLLDDAAPR